VNCDNHITIDDFDAPRIESERARSRADNVHRRIRPPYPAQKAGGRDVENSCTPRIAPSITKPARLQLFASVANVGQMRFETLESTIDVPFHQQSLVHYSP
jgi:hypothetical protein